MNPPGEILARLALLYRMPDGFSEYLPGNTLFERQFALFYLDNDQRPLRQNANFSARKNPVSP
jgi:hypothetical protein